MSSKREKKIRRRAGNEKLRAAQRAGRPKQAGERYACGKLKPRKNERVIEAKKALVGDGLDIALADDPLDFIHAKDWLSTTRYRTALAYRDVRRRANVGGPRLDGAGVGETSSTTGVAGRSFRDMTDEEIAAVFDHVFRELPKQTAEEREAEALQKWMRLEAAMTLTQRREVGLIVVQASWTFWMTAMNLGKEPEGRHLQARQDFFDGLDAMRRALRPADQASRPGAADRIESASEPSPQKVEENLRFVDEDGRPVDMVGQTGRRFEVARKVRA